jgi:hypothetical protein
VYGRASGTRSVRATAAAIFIAASLD